MDNILHFTVNCLPDEILLRIFSFLNVNETLNSLPPVCQRWRQLVLDPSLRRHLGFYIKGKNTEKEKYILSISSHLLSLKIVDFFNKKSLLFQVVNSCKNLQKLDLYYYYNSLSSRIIIELARECPKLIHLNVRGYRYDLDFNIGIFSEFTQLRYFKFRGLSIKGFDLLSEKCPFLETVSISINNSSEKYEIYFNEKLQNNLKIFEIRSSGSCFTDTSMKTLSGCIFLEELHLWDCHEITDWGLSKIYQLKNLRSLIIDHCFGISNAGMSNLFRVKLFPKLVHLNLIYLNINFEVIKNIPNVFPKLKVLGIVKCENMDARLLSGLKHHNPNLIINTNWRLVKTLMNECLSEYRTWQNTSTNPFQAEVEEYFSVRSCL